MVVHGKSPAQVAAQARKAWIALALSPIIGLAIVFGGEGIYAMAGRIEGELLPYGQRVLVTLVVLPLALAAPALAARWGHQAHSAGNRSARVPGIAGIVICVLAGAALIAPLMQP